MNGWVMLLILGLVETIVLLGATLAWRDGPAFLSRLSFAIRDDEQPSQEQYAQRLIDAHRALLRLSEKAALDGDDAQAGACAAALTSLRQSAERFRAEPNAAMRCGMPLLTACEQLTRLLDRAASA